MTDFPLLKTQRLVLRAFDMQDAPAVAAYCSDWELASTTANIPHPYDVSLAQVWIAGHRAALERDDAITFAITLAESGKLVGAVGLHFNKQFRLAEVGYWIGVPHWGRGIATEAAGEMIRFAFEDQGLNRVQARHMTRNPASGRVMEKVGMRFEGILRQSIFRWDRFEDVAMYSILRSEFGGHAADVPH
jgi:ribosomal-protein-alanine N-acetyltransferase